MSHNMKTLQFAFHLGNTLVTMSVFKSIVKPSIDSQGKKYKTTDRHRGHSKKHNQVLKELKSQGKSTEVAKQLARDAACKHVKAMFKA